MTYKSILTLSEEELQAQFGEGAEYSELMRNAQKYRDEIINLLNSNKGSSLRPILKKLFQIENRFHKGNIWRAFGDDKGAIYQYSKIKKGENGYEKAQLELLKICLFSEKDIEKARETAIRYLENMGEETPEYCYACMLIGDFLYKNGNMQEALEYYLRVDTESNPDRAITKQSISQVSEEIDEVSLENGRMVLRKGEEFELNEYHLDIIDHISPHLDYHGDRANPSYYVISLSNNENGMQEGRFNFFCVSYSDIDADKADEGIFVEPCDLDALIHPKTVIFEGINKKGEIVFKEISDFSSKKPFSIGLLEAQKSLRVKGDLEYTGSEEDYLVWEQGNSEVIAITYGENHPQTILRNIKEEINNGFIGDASDLLIKLKEGSPEYITAKKLVEEEAAQQTEIMTGMIERGEFPAGNSN